MKKGQKILEIFSGQRHLYQIKRKKEVKDMTPNIRDKGKTKLENFD
jgi:hypothetical protein